MEWINIHRSVTQSAEFKGAEPLDRATWFSLLDYCCSQENDGIIEQCRDWPDRKWQQVAGVTKAEAERACDLWTWNPDGSLEINFYPHDSQKEVVSKRRAAVNTNRKLRHKRDAQRDAQRQGSGHAQRDANEMKGKERQGNEREEAGVVGVVIPTEQAVLAVAAGFPGDMARGIPSGIPEGYALDWLNWRLSPSAGPFPPDWPGDLTRRFTSSWVKGDPRAKKMAQKNGAVPPAVTAVANSKRLTALGFELRAVEEQIHALDQCGAEVPPELRQQRRALTKEQQELQAA